jgi:DNA-directed RNA polymerase subunit omega
MNIKHLEAALKQVPNPELLVNLVSRRVRQLAQGHRPITQTDPRMDFADIALKEIAEGKMSYEVVAPEADETPAA